ncbi:MAG: hypothetical protein WBA23_13155 [Tunicatimonas sp.]|uniref:hypothetical protein n=1 Tax=Tunicatimonas sp. TaxID=1940096 RepID=UPI003C75EFC7
MKYILIVCWFLLCFSLGYAQATDSAVPLFYELHGLSWEAQMSPIVGSSWSEHWTVDGYRAEIKSTSEGTLFFARGQ